MSRDTSEEKFASGRNASLPDPKENPSPRSCTTTSRRDKLAQHVYAHAPSSFMYKPTWQRLVAHSSPLPKSILDAHTRACALAHVCVCTLREVTRSNQVMTTALRAYTRTLGPPELTSERLCRECRIHGRYRERDSN